MCWPTFRPKRATPKRSGARRGRRVAGGAGCDRGLGDRRAAVGADGALDAGADAQPVRRACRAGGGGDPDLVAVLADMGIDGIAGVWRAVKRRRACRWSVEYAGDHAWFGVKVVALRKADRAGDRRGACVRCPGVAA